MRNTLDHIMNAVEREMRKAKARASQIVRRSMLNLIRSEGGRSALQVDRIAEEVGDDVELMESYGFRSIPHPGSEGLVLSVGADNANQVGLLFSRRSDGESVDLEAGEVGIYNSAGCKIILRTNGDIEIVSAGSLLLGNENASLGVARKTDPVNVPSIDALLAALQAFVPGGPDGGAALSKAMVGALQATAGDGQITEGSTIVKAS